MDSTLTVAPSTSRRSILLTIIFAAVCLVGLYYLYRFLYTTATLQRTIVVANEIPGNVVPSSLPSIPTLYEGGEYTINLWVYVNSYNINRNARKHILEIGGAQFSTLLVGLGAFKNTVCIRTHYADAITAPEGFQDWVPSGLLGRGGQFDVDSDGYTDACPKGRTNLYTGLPCTPVTGLRGPPSNYPSDRRSSASTQLKYAEDLQKKLAIEYAKSLDPAARAEYIKLYGLGQMAASGDEGSSDAYEENQIVEYNDLVNSYSRRGGDDALRKKYAEEYKKKLEEYYKKYSTRIPQTGHTGLSTAYDNDVAPKPDHEENRRTPSSTSTPNSNDSTSNGSLTRANVDSFFKPLALDDSILTTSTKCDLPEIDMQRWTMLTINLNGRTTDVYLDGKLARSCVGSSYYKVDSTGVKINLCDYGGFDGHITGVSAYNYSLTPSDIYNTYVSGPNANGTSDLFAWLFSPFKRT